MSNIDFGMKVFFNTVKSKKVVINKRTRGSSNSYAFVMCNFSRLNDSKISGGWRVDRRYFCDKDYGGTKELDDSLMENAIDLDSMNVWTSKDFEKRGLDQKYIKETYLDHINNPNPQVYAELDKRIDEEKYKFQQKQKSIVYKDLDKQLMIYSSERSIIDKLTTFRMDKCGKYINITKEFLCDPMFLKFSYYLIRKSRGAESQLDGINNDWFNKAASKIKNAQYIFKDAKQTNIPKPHKVGVRTITITDGRDRIIQKAIAIILDLIYERDGYFHEESQGFRPGKSCHTALKQIKYG